MVGLLPQVVVVVLVVVGVLAALGRFWVAARYARRHIAAGCARRLPFS